LYGFNTDVIGFEQSLSEYLKPHHKNALILGTGGAAKAVEYVLEKLGIAFLHVSRIADAPKNIISYDQVNDKILSTHTLIINTTPLGMFPEIQTYPAIPYGSLTKGHYLFDLVYNPSLTIFLEKGKKQGATIKNGYDMLVLQAEESWRIWNAE
jgi:shikimate dehydrogenase